MRDRLDISIHDEEVLAEIELISALMIAASEHEHPLSQAEVDAILGVPRPA